MTQRTDEEVEQARKLWGDGWQEACVITPQYYGPNVGPFPDVEEAKKALMLWGWGGSINHVLSVHDKDKLVSPDEYFAFVKSETARANRIGGLARRLTELALSTPDMSPADKVRALRDAIAALEQESA